MDIATFYSPHIKLFYKKVRIEHIILSIEKKIISYRKITKNCFVQYKEGFKLSYQVDKVSRGLDNRHPSLQTAFNEV